MTSPAPHGLSGLPPELRPLRPGDPARIGPYRVVGRLGQGGMGTVFGALDGRNTCVAVKVVHAEFAAEAEFRAGFAREVALMRRVGGLCTAAVHAADPDAERPWVATDFVPGRTLRAHVREHGPLEGDLLLGFAAGVAESLAAIHSTGVVHCDLKPGNVILAPDGPKVLDFGIARLADEGVRAQGALFGSPGWMSPERYARHAPTPAADMFAWGGMVAFAATGRSPFGSGSTAELARRTLHDPPDTAGVPEELLPLVERALAKDPAVRPTAGDALRVVLALMGEGEETRGEGPDALTERLRLRLARHWRGIDASWHRPALWVAAASAVSAAATASTATGPGAVGVATGGTGTGSVGAATGGAATGGAATGGAATGGAATGGAVAVGAGVTGGKVAAAVTAAVVGAAAIGGGGYLAAESQPAEIVADSVALVENASSFRATQWQRPTEEAVRREHPGASGAEVADLVAAGERSVSYTYASSPGAAVEAAVTDGAGETATYRQVDGESYLHTARYRGLTDVWLLNWHGSDPVAPGALAVEAFTAPLRALPEAASLTDEGRAEVSGRPGTRYSGLFDAVSHAGTPLEQTLPSTPFEFVVAADGHPLRLAYTTDLVEYEVVFESFDEPVTVAAPSPDATVAGACGPSLDGEWLVDASSPGVSCQEALRVLDGYLTEPDTQPQGSGAFAEFDGWTCFVDLEPVVDATYGGCGRGGPAFSYYIPWVPGWVAESGCTLSHDGTWHLSGLERTTCSAAAAAVEDFLSGRGPHDGGVFLVDSGGWSCSLYHVPDSRTDIGSCEGPGLEVVRFHRVRG